MELPPHIAYIQLAAVFIFVQGLSYWFVYRDQSANLGLVRVGVVYKAAYSGLALWYLVIGQLPSNFFIPWAVVDVLFLVGFLLFLRSRRAADATSCAHPGDRPTPVELTADRRITRRVKRLSVVSAVALGLIWGLAVGTVEAPTLVDAALAAGWMLMPTVLVASLAWPRLRYGLILPSGLVTAPCWLSPSADCLRTRLPPSAGCR